MERGALIISLDFELLWGVFDKVNWREKILYFNNTRKVIPKILEIFEKNGIASTWATVGMLFNENWEEWDENIPGILPNYSNQKLSAYSFGKSIQQKETEYLCFAPDLISLICQTPYQELGTHTYSHYYCLEEGQDKNSFKEDLMKAVSVASKYKTPLKSLVFPRNQLKEEYLNICSNFGIINVRSNPNSWYWNEVQSNSVFIKLARTGDAYIPLGRKSYEIFDLERKPNLPLMQKSSRFLRPVEENSFLRKAKIQRILREMENAAKKGEIYHLWWHPHNFGIAPDKSIDDLLTILKYFRKLHNKYSFESMNMGDLGSLESLKT